MTEVLKRAILAPWNSIRTDDALPGLGWLWPGEGGSPLALGHPQCLALAPLHRQQQSLWQSAECRGCAQMECGKWTEMENLPFAIQPNPIFYQGEQFAGLHFKRWENSELMRAPGCWDKSNLPPILSFRLSDFSHSYSSFTYFLTISTRLTSQFIAVVGSRSSSTFSFITFCHQNCWHTDLHPQYSDSSNAEHKKI